MFPGFLLGGRLLERAARGARLFALFPGFLLGGRLLERAARGARRFALFPDWPFGNVGVLLGGGDLALCLGPWGEVVRLSVLLDGALLRAGSAGALRICRIYRTYPQATIQGYYHLSYSRNDHTAMNNYYVWQKTDRNAYTSKLFQEALNYICNCMHIQAVHETTHWFISIRQVHACHLNNQLITFGKPTN